jgi:CRISPR-associated protein Cmr2
MTFEYVDPLLSELRDLDKGQERARGEYQKRPPIGRAPYEVVSPTLLRDWLDISVTFQLQTPWFSKDDVPFHVLDNPIHRDRVFGAPFMPASSWKGLLRWAARMKSAPSLLSYLEENKNDLKLSGWKDSRELIHLFGNECEANDFQRGALAFHPTWFDKVGFEVINPHSRAKKAGTHPIYYEVVPPEATGTLNVLYAPVPGVSEPRVDRQKAILLLFDAVESLITEYGFSAKRTSGWGVATIMKARLRWRGGSRVGKLSDRRVQVTKLLEGAA